MERMLRHARAGGVVRVWGDVMAENAAMLRLAGALGFRLERIADQPAIMRATLDLR
jgi:RimJ/RimL family protein N-acetyltransferase